MTKEEYQETQMKLVMIRRLCDDLPLNEFLRAIEHADAVGLITDPTLWRKGHRELDKVRDLAEALRAFAVLPFPTYAEASVSP